MMAKKLTISTSRNPVLKIFKESLKDDKLVYIAIANKTITYPTGKSKIVYIGTTKNGIDRIATSAANKAKLLFKKHRINSLEFHLITCTKRQRVQSWLKLEKALLIKFREVYGSVPIGNTQGKNMRWGNELQLFTENRIKSILNKFK